MKMHAALGLISSAAFVFSMAGSARADAITMPASCPASSEDAFCHGPATCRPRACIAAADCAVGEVCAARSLCTETHACAGFPMTTSVQHVFGDCTIDGSCPSGGACAAYFVCVPNRDAGPVGDAGTMPEHTTYCGCRVGTRSGDASALAMMLVALGAFVARRLRRAHSGMPRRSRSSACAASEAMRARTSSGTLSARTIR
jgi:MYXO-CTERM domain-containing protein